MASDHSLETHQGQLAGLQADPDDLSQIQPASPAQTDPSYPPQAFMKMSVFEQKTMSGPLPPASEVAGYNAVIPHGAERIMVMAEKEQQARLEETKRAQSLDERALKGFNFRGAFAQIAAFLLTVFALLVGVYLAIHGQAELAGTIFKFTITAVVSSFLVGQASKLITEKRDKGKEDNG